MKRIKPLFSPALWRAFVLCTLSFAGTAGTTPALAQKQENGHLPPAKLSGLYRAFPAVAQFGAAVGEAYVFSARRDVYQGWTGTQAPEAFDFARAKSREPAHTGTYLISGGTITFRWSNRQSETASFNLRRDPKTGRATLTIGPNYGYKLVLWNQPLNGTFEPSTYQGGFSDLNKQAPPLVDGITFSSDGRFTLAGDGAKLPTTGRYKVGGAALTLTLPNGEVRTHSLHVFEGHQKPPTTVLIDGRPFVNKAK